jgi:rhamnose transport system substrate-binding protein
VVKNVRRCTSNRIEAGSQQPDRTGATSNSSRVGGHSSQSRKGRIRMYASPARSQRSRQFRAFGAVLLAICAAALIAACGGSSNSGTSSNSGGSSGGGSSTGSLKKGLNFYVIPKNLGNNYFTVADSVKTGGALAAISSMGDKGTETSGSDATSADQLPVIQSAISKGANVLEISATDPTALCPTLKQAMARGVTVVTYDSDVNKCRDLMVAPATAQTIGASEVDLIAKQIHDTGQIAIVSAEASAPNQNQWIGFMKTELKKYPKIKLVSTVYGNDDPTTAAQVTSGLLQHYPHLAGIISPTTVGILAAAGVLDTPQYRGKVALTGLGTPDAMKKFVEDGTVNAFELWNPAELGYVGAEAGAQIASKTLKVAPGTSFSAGKFGKFTISAGNTVYLGKMLVFNKANINKFNF